MKSHCHSSLSPAFRLRRFGGSPFFFVVGLSVIALVLGGIVWAATNLGKDEVKDLPLMANAEYATFSHIVLEQGEVESSNNVEIRCEVRSRTSGSGPSTSIIDVIPEGTIVEKGDWLITFDSSALEQEASQQRIVVNTSEAIMIQAKAEYDTSVIARDEYLKGTYNEERKAIENEIFVAEENLKKAQLSYDSIKRLVSRGLLTSLQLEGEKFRVEAAQNELDLARQKLSVLDEYTKVKMLTQLESDIKAAEVRYRNEQDSYREEQKKLQEIQDQVAHCRVTAPQAGQVVYANVQSSRSGSEFVVEPGVAVRERQVIIRLPDPSQMQIKASISESRINLIKVGMPVDIRIDAFGDQSLRGEVTKVNKYAEPGNWWSSSAKEYVTLVRIFDPPPQIRVGLTAEVQIVVNRLDEALLIPVQTVYERHGETFCLVRNGSSFDTRKVEILATDDKMVALNEELSEVKSGEQLVMNPRRHLGLFDESRFPAEPDDGRGADNDDAVAKQAKSDEASEPVADDTGTSSPTEDAETAQAAVDSAQETTIDAGGGQ